MVSRGLAVLQRTCRRRGEWMVSRLWSGSRLGKPRCAVVRRRGPSGAGGTSAAATIVAQGVWSRLARGGSSLSRFRVPCASLRAMGTGPSGVCRSSARTRFQATAPDPGGAHRDPSRAAGVDVLAGHGLRELRRPPRLERAPGRCSRARQWCERDRRLILRTLRRRPGGVQRGACGPGARHHRDEGACRGARPSARRRRRDLPASSAGVRPGPRPSR